MLGISSRITCIRVVCVRLSIHFCFCQHTPTERIELLNHIIRIFMDYSSNRLPILRDVDVHKLEEVTRQWFDDKEESMNAKKEVYLNELFRIIKKEEKYRRGDIGKFPASPLS